MIPKIDRMEVADLNGVMRMSLYSNNDLKIIVKYTRSGFTYITYAPALSISELHYLLGYIADTTPIAFKHNEIIFKY